jgi:hypothetical protein
MFQTGKGRALRRRRLLLVANCNPRKGSSVSNGVLIVETSRSDFHNDLAYSIVIDGIISL